MRLRLLWLPTFNETTPGRIISPGVRIRCPKPSTVCSSREDSAILVPKAVQFDEEARVLLSPCLMLKSIQTLETCPSVPDSSPSHTRTCFAFAYISRMVRTSQFLSTVLSWLIHNASTQMILGLSKSPKSSIKIGCNLDPPFRTKVPRYPRFFAPDI